MMNEEERNQLKETVISVLKTIYDPEIPVDIWTLHLIYGIDVDEEGNVKIVMTVTAPNCPVAETLPPEVQQRVQGMENNTVQVVDIDNDMKIADITVGVESKGGFVRNSSPPKPSGSRSSWFSLSFSLL